MEEQKAAEGTGEPEGGAIPGSADEVKQAETGAPPADAKPDPEKSEEQKAAEQAAADADAAAKAKAVEEEKMASTIKSGAQAIVDGDASHGEVVNYVSKMEAAIGMEIDHIEGLVKAEVSAIKRTLLQFPMTALICKYADKVAVEVRDLAHLDCLTAEHGESGVEIQAQHVPTPKAPEVQP